MIELDFTAASFTITTTINEVDAIGITFKNVFGECNFFVCMCNMEFLSMTFSSS